MKKKKRYILAAACVMAVLLAAYLKMTPGPVRYHGLPQAVWLDQDRSSEVSIEGVVYEFYGPKEADMKRGRLVAYLEREDGYYTEYYEIKGEDDLLFSVRRVIMGDQYVIRVQGPDKMEEPAIRGNR